MLPCFCYILQNDSLFFVISMNRKKGERGIEWKLDRKSEFPSFQERERRCNMDLREKIINAAIDEFREKGLKFTLDDVTKRLSISKKTIYTVFKDKEEMLLAVADYCFADIKKSEQEVLQNPDLDVVEKIKKIMVVMPDRYQNIGLSNLYQLQDKFPGIYKRVEKYLETDWDGTIALLEQGMKEGKIRPVSIPLVKAMVESTISHFFASDVLINNGISYEQGLSEMIDIIMKGIEA